MNLMDWIGFITGVICVWLIVREKDINWPIGLLNSVALLVVFGKQKLYAQGGLQAFYIVECAYGWWLWTRWTRQRDSNSSALAGHGSSRSRRCV